MTFDSPAPGSATGSPPPTPAPSMAARLLRPLRSFFQKHGTFPLTLFVFTRCAYMLVSFMGLELVPELWFNEGHRQAFLKPYPFLDGLCRWDCGWFVTIYKNGYSTLENAKVFPLLPMIGWAIEKVTGLHHLLVFLLVANGAALASYYVIYQLFRELEGDDAARWGLLLFCAYPFAFFQAAAYPESLMVLASSLALLLALRKRHIWAGLVLGLGVMARHITLFGGAGLLVAQLRQRGLHPKRFLLSPAVLGLAIPFLFIGLFSWHLSVKIGDPLAWWNSRSIGWNDWVWYGARQVIMYVPYQERPEYFFYIGFAMIPTLGAFLLATKKKYLELSADAAVLMMVVLGSGAAGMGRYSASCWPAFLPLGLWLSRRPALQGPAIVSLAVIQGLFLFLFTHQWRLL